MNSAPNIILAVAPGKRELGIAVFINSDLVYCSVKTIKQQKSNKLLFDEITGILQSLFGGFSVRIVIIKAVTQYQKQSSSLEKIVERIRVESKQNGLEVVEITIKQI